MGGIGKTTLAQFVYNDNDVINHFGKRIWVCVSDPFDEYRIAKAIIEALEGSATNLVELNALLLRINESIAREKFLLVLDDVWTEDYNKWESFRRCLINGQRGRISRSFHSNFKVFRTAAVTISPSYFLLVIKFCGVKK
ncbi:hypothetical protein WN944_023617 [Citrus x changshan-huyou]|uniref:NB-ARC domain-containing protein n=1 Tax=Citrus x changshan-huyou TaxID=2935761 RepID=A0AAP0N4X9_9ROSI